MSVDSEATCAQRVEPGAGEEGAQDASFVNSPLPGSVWLHKVDDAGADLAGALFTLHSDAAPTGGSLGAGDLATSFSCTSDGAGVCTITDVPVGAYWLVETVPFGYAGADPIAVVIGPGQDIVLTTDVVNRLLLGSILVRKLDQDGAALAGATFSLTPSGSLAAVAGQTGLFCANGLSYDDYTVTESTVPDGYTGAAPQAFTVASESTCAARVEAGDGPDLTFVNVALPGSVQLTKADDAGAALAGAEFTLHSDATPGDAFDAVSDLATSYQCLTVAGACTISAVPHGAYWLVETVTPYGHATAAPVAIAIAPGQDVVVSATIVDVGLRGSILVQKVDQDGAALAGAAFSLTPAGVSVSGAGALPAVAGQTGLFCSDGLLYAEYIIGEATVPSGYAGAAPKAFTVASESTCATRVEAGDGPDLTFVNVALPGSVQLAKADDAGAALAGAEFTLHSDATPGDAFDAVSDLATSYQCLTAAGACTISAVPHGAYWLVETVTPYGHATAAPIAIAIAPGEDVVVSATIVDVRLRGSILMQKVDQDGAALAGAAFSLTPAGVSVSGAGALPAVAGQTGLFCSDGLLYAEYIIGEATVPSGYAGAAPKAFTVASESTCATRVEAGDGPDLTFVNVALPGSVQLTKADDAGAPLAGAEFTLHSDATPGDAFDAVTDGATSYQCLTIAGACTISAVPHGAYWLVETVTPYGHATAAPIAIAIAPGEDVVVSATIVDVRLRGSILMQKVDQDGAALAGATFSLTPSGSLDPVTGQTGLFCATGLLYDDYTVTESTVPDGYTGAASRPFTVASESTCATRVEAGDGPDLTFVNVALPGSVQLTKADDAGAPLAGAEFTLHSDATPGDAFDAVTDGATSYQCLTIAGACTISAVPHGAYWLVETVTPYGHATAAPIAIAIAPGEDVVVSATIVDVRLLGSILVQKVDQDGAALAGATFSLTPSGSLNAVAGQTGLFCATGLLYDDYTVTESTVPDGYTGAASRPFTVASESTCADRVADGDAPDLTFDNARLPGAIQVRKTADHATQGSSPLAGVLFTVSGPGLVGDVPLTATDAQGVICLGGLTVGGAYTVTEVGAPAGYVLDAPQTIVVSDDATCATPVDVLRFHDQPLSEIEVIFRSLAGAGVTLATIDCSDALPSA